MVNRSKWSQLNIYDVFNNKLEGKNSTYNSRRTISNRNGRSRDKRSRNRRIKNRLKKVND
jgi:hypothetical protein